MTSKNSTSSGQAIRAVNVGVNERVAFIQRTYLHLGAAILVFVGLEYILLQTPFAPWFLEIAFGSNINWLIILGAFIVVAWIADKWAHSENSSKLQYLGLGLYVAAESVLFLPLLFYAASFASPTVIPSAAIMTLTVFAGLTAIVFVTRADFSFMRMGLMVAGLLAMGLVVSSLVVGFNLGVVFSIAMVGLAAGYILYNTSNILHEYRPDQHVAASLALFADVALMFWYILRLFIFQDDD